MVKKDAKSTTTTKKSGGSSSSHPTYREMIKDAIINLKERNGSSRPALKKYIQSNNTINVATQAAFDSQVNKAIKAGVEKGEFFQPKGPSGTVKLAKKEPAPKTAAKPAAKPAAKKTETTKTSATKKAPAKKPAAKSTTTKKAAAPKKSTAAKPKANTAKPRKAAASAPAVVEVPKVLGKTKSGRVTKTTGQPAATKKAPAKRTSTAKKASEKK